MNPGLTVTVLMGGPDAEREVSLSSGGRVAAALSTFDDLQVATRIIDAPGVRELGGMFDEDETDVVFPMLHGAWGEGGTLQSHLETLGIPFVGSRRATAELAMDKLRSKAIVEGLDIPTPPSMLVVPGRGIDLPLPIVLKPVSDGSSVGVRAVSTPEELGPARRELESRHDRIMAEGFVSGRELTVAVAAGEILPPIEIIPASGFYDYEAKYIRDDTRYVVSPDLPPGVGNELADWSLKILETFEVRDFGRVDWLLPRDPAGPCHPSFLEVNTIPGMTDHSLVPMAAASIGLPMPALCRRLAEIAHARG